MLSLRNSLFAAILVLGTCSSGAVLAEDAGVASDAGITSDAGTSSSVGSAEHAAELVVKAIDLALAGQWLLLAIILIQLGVFAVKKYAPAGFMKTWGSVTVGVMAASVAFLSNIVGGLSWQEALVVFLSGPASSLTVDALHAVGWLKRESDNA